jgi:PleD family two-component response regulator
LRTNDQALRVTASFGAAELLPGESSSSLKERADQALYAAKAAGRNLAMFHNGTCIVASLAEQLAGQAF